MTDHQTLLAEYTRNGSDAAFRELVTRYVDLVFSTALWLVEGDTHRADTEVERAFGQPSLLPGPIHRPPQGWPNAMMIGIIRFNLTVVEFNQPEHGAFGGWAVQ